MGKFNFWTAFKKILGKIGLKAAETELLDEEKVDIEAALKSWYAANPTVAMAAINGFKSFLPYIQTEAVKKNVQILNDEIATVQSAIDEFLASLTPTP